ncbi:Bgt-50648, partial [Blumeria graminis f. sp. tritici]
CSSIPIQNQNSKFGDVTLNFKPRIVEESSPCINGVKELVSELCLLRFGENANFIDTPRDSAVLYNPMIAAFLDTIEKINYGIIRNKTLTLRA